MVVTRCVNTTIAHAIGPGIRWGTGGGGHWYPRPYLLPLSHIRGNKPLPPSSLKMGGVSMAFIFHDFYLRPGSHFGFLQLSLRIITLNEPTGKVTYDPSECKKGVCLLSSFITYWYWITCWKWQKGFFFQEISLWIKKMLWVELFCFFKMVLIV